MLRGPIRYRGKWYATFSKLARACGLAPSLLYHRLHRGLSVDEAIRAGKRKVPVKTRPHPMDKPITIEGQRFETHTAAANYYGLGLTTLRDRIMRQGMTADEAVRVEKRRIPVPVTLEGESYTNLKQASEKYGLEADTVICRLRRSWSLEDAFGLTERPDEDVSGVVYLITNTADRMAYVGHTRTTADKRWQRHVKDAKKRNFRPNSIAEAISLYGHESFEIRVLAKSDGSLRDLLRLEKRFIKELNTRWPNGYNHSLGVNMRRLIQLNTNWMGDHFRRLKAWLSIMVSRSQPLFPKGLEVRPLRRPSHNRIVIVTTY